MADKQSKPTLVYGFMPEDPIKTQDVIKKVSAGIYAYAMVANKRVKSVEVTFHD